MQRGVTARQYVAAAITWTAFPVRDDAAGVLDQRDQCLDVVRLQPGFDDDVDETHRELRIAIAIAAVAHETRTLRRDRIRIDLSRAAEMARVGRGDDRVLDARTATRAQCTQFFAAP